MLTGYSVERCILLSKPIVSLHHQHTLSPSMISTTVAPIMQDQSILRHHLEGVFQDHTQRCSQQV